MKKILLYASLLCCVHFASAQKIPSYIPTDSLVGWYPFTGNADDESGKCKNGTVGGATLTTDRFGNPNCAYLFNGTTDSILIDTPFFNTGWSNYSISFWLNSNTLNNSNNNNNNQPPFGTQPHNGIGMGFNWGHSNKYSFWANSLPQDNIYNWDIFANATANTPVTINTWNHIIVVKQNDTLYKIYINSVLDTIFKTSVIAKQYYSKLLIGNANLVVSNEVFSGSLDDFGFWNRALTDDEILGIYTGIKETRGNSNTIQPLIYPNPADDFITIRIESNLLNQIYFVDDMLGRRVLSGKLARTTTNLSLTELPPGVYTLSIEGNGVLPIKIVKQ